MRKDFSKLRKILCVVLACFTLLSTFAFASCRKQAEAFKPDDVSLLQSKENLVDPSRKGIDVNNVVDYFVKNNQTEYAILLPENAGENEVYASKIIYDNVFYVTGVKMPVVYEGTTQVLSDKIISIGATKAKDNMIKNVNYNELKTGGFFIKNVGKSFYLDSGCPEGVVYSAWEFLNIYFGVEFLDANDYYRPKLRDAKAYSADLIDIPVFDIRDVNGYYARFDLSEAGAAMSGMNSINFSKNEKLNDYYYYGYYYENPKGEIESTVRFGHTISRLINADAYVTGVNPDPDYKTSENGARSNWGVGYSVAHPEWHAYMPDGDVANRITGRCQDELCFTNGLTLDGEYDTAQDVSDECDTALEKMIEMCFKMGNEEPSKSAKYLMLGTADFNSWCICERCQEAEDVLGSKGALYMAWINAVAKGVKAKMAEAGIERDVQFGYLAYHFSLNPPVTYKNGEWVATHKNAVPRDDIFVQICWRTCVYHSAYDTSCQHNEINRTRFDGWRAICHNFAIWDYSANFWDYFYYVPNFSYMKENYLMYEEIGVHTVLTQMAPNEGNYYESQIHTYLSAHLLWNPHQNVNEIIERFNNLFFTPKYATYVNEYNDLFLNRFAYLDSTKDGGFHATTGDDYNYKSTATFPQAMLQKAIDLLHGAIDEVKKDENLTVADKEKIVERLTGVLITPQWIMYDLGYIVEESQFKVFAKDMFDNLELLNINLVREGFKPNYYVDTLRAQAGV